MNTRIEGVSANDSTLAVEPAVQDFVYWQNATQELQLVVTLEDGTAKDLTGLTPKLVTRRPNGQVLTIEFELDADPETGLATYTLSADDALYPGSYRYEVYLDDGAGGQELIVPSSTMTVKATALPVPVVP